MNKYQKIAKSFFVLNGDPFPLTLGQSEIFRVVYEPPITRATVLAITQYGKSEVTALALIIACIERREQAVIVAPDEKRAGIIMGYFIQHLFDHPYITAMIELEGSLERLRQERSKRRITFKNSSEVRLLTAEAHVVAREARSLMGFGGSIVVCDESALIPDQMFSKILRMVGGVEHGKLVQLGNPFERNHFFRAFKSPRYEKVKIDYHQALKEGRLTQEFLNEARDDMPTLDFGIFYECKFPEEGTEDSLIPAEWINLAVNQQVSEGDKEAGLDVARFGRDKTVYCLRTGGVVKRLEVIEKRDTMEVAGWTAKQIDNDKPQNANVDVIGIGSGVYDRLNELKYNVTPINVGEKAQDEERFFNLRSEMLWRLAMDWFKPSADGKSNIAIPDDLELKRQVKEIRYGYDSRKRIKIESKEDMKKRLGQSPDKLDALMLAFCSPSAGSLTPVEEQYRVRGETAGLIGKEF